jgi:hypothetical protein
VSAFLLLYALTISIELILSLVMAVFLFLVVAPVGGRQPEPAGAPPARPLARTVEGALGDAFATVSEGRDDVAALTNARSLLTRYRAEREAERQRAG